MSSSGRWRRDGDLALPAGLWADCKSLVILTLTPKPHAGHAWIAPLPQPLRAAA